MYGLHLNGDPEPWEELEQGGRLDDLWAITEELNEKFGFGYAPNRERIEAKKAKVRKYLGFSIHLGMVEGETAVREHPMTAPVMAELEIK